MKFYLSTYSLDYKSIKQRKRVTAISLCGMVMCGRSCGVDVSGRLSGMSGGNVYGQIQVFQAQRIPVPYNILEGYGMSQGNTITC